MDKMKKNAMFLGLAGLLVAAVVSIGVASCSKDDKETTIVASEVTNANMIGTWYGGRNDEGEGRYWRLTFNKDYTGSFNYRQDYSYSGDVNKTYQFKYQMVTSTMGSLYIAIGSGSEVGYLLYEFILDEGKLLLFQNGDNDADCILTKQ